MVSRIDRKQVVDTALRLLNEVGLDGLTLRRIAKELNVQAPALYWHFKNKQELLDEMATEMFRRMTTPQFADEANLGETWQEMVLRTSRSLRSELLGYRDGGKVFSGTRLTDESFALPLHTAMSRFTDAGFTLGQGARAWWTAYNFTIGLVIEEQSVYPTPGEPGVRDPAYDQERREQLLGASYPLAVQVGREMFGDIERNFEEGLRIIIAGIEATVFGRN